jgi:uncharacterized protein
VIVGWTESANCLPSVPLAEEIAQWLESLEPGSTSFDWDAGNQKKNRKHGVEASEIEELLNERMVLAGRIVEPAHGEPRWLLLASSSASRRLALIFTRRVDRLRPASCRPVRRKERKVYEDAIQGEE